MQPLILTCLALGLGAPSAEEAARLVAEGGESSGPALEALMRKGRSGLKALVKVGKSSKGASRRRAYTAMGVFRGDEAEAGLMEGFGFPDADAKVGAIRGLSKQGTAAAAEVITRAATNPELDVRRAALSGLLEVGDPAVPSVRRLERSPNAYAREIALRFFVQRESGRDRRRSILSSIRDPAVNVRIAAIELTQRWKDMRLAEALVRLTRDRDAEVAARAVEAVAKFPALRKELPRVLSDPRVNRQAWITAFHRLRDYDDMAIPYLIAAISRADPKRRVIMLDLISADASDADLRSFVSMLDRPEEDLTELVRDLLVRLGARADTAAARMVLDERESLVEAILEYLENRPRHGITDEILDSTKDGPVDDRTRHINIIGELGPQEVQEDLVGLLEDTETQVRIAAARVLAGLKDPDAEAELVRLLDDPKPEVRIEATRALKAYETRLSVLARMSAIEDPSPRVRTVAMKTFEGSDSEQVLDILERVVRSGTSEERVIALGAIAEVRTPRAAVLLVELVTDDSSEVRAAAGAYFDTLPPLAGKE